MGAAIYIPVPDPDCRDVTNRSDQVQIKTGMLDMHQIKCKVSTKKSLSAFLQDQFLPYTITVNSSW